MNAEQSNDPQRNDRKHEHNKVPRGPADGSEAAQKGGKGPAHRQAERDWENSAKESGE